MEGDGEGVVGVVASCYNDINQSQRSTCRFQSDFSSNFIHRRQAETQPSRIDDVLCDNKDKRVQVGF